MKPLMADPHSRRSLRWSLALLGGVALSVTLNAQSPPPVQGSIALEGTMKKFYRAANTIVVTTIDGVEHMYHFTKDLLVHGGKGAGIDALQGLQEGSTVVVHYTVEGTGESAREIDRVDDEGLRVTEGVITRIDHRRRHITIRFADRRTERFQLTDRAAAEATEDIEQAGTSATRVVIYYSDEAGRKVAHFVKKISRE